MRQLTIDFRAPGQIDDDGDDENDDKDSEPPSGSDTTCKNQVTKVEDITGWRTEWNKARWKKQGGQNEAQRIVVGSPMIEEYAIN